MSHLNADRRRETVAHCAQTARGHPTVRIFKAEELCGPHLVLANLGRDVTIHAFGQFFETLQRVLRFDRLFRARIGEAVDFSPFVNLGPPFRQTFFFGHAATGFPDFQDILEDMCNIANDAEVNVDDLVDRGRIDIDVNLFRLWRESINAARDTVVETCADVDHQITVVHRHVGFIKAVHTQHTEPFVARRRISAQTHQGRGDREASGLNQFAQQLGGRRARVDHAATSVEDRALGFLHQLHEVIDALDGTLNLWLVV